MGLNFRGFLAIFHPSRVALGINGLAGLGMYGLDFKDVANWQRVPPLLPILPTGAVTHTSGVS